MCRWGFKAQMFNPPLNLNRITKLKNMQKDNLKKETANSTNTVLGDLISDREKDILKLCEAVLTTSPNCWDNPNGAYETSCPFCSAEERRGGGGSIWASMSELKHSGDCAYLIAKDLSTGML